MKRATEALDVGIDLGLLECRHGNFTLQHLQITRHWGELIVTRLKLSCTHQRIHRHFIGVNTDIVSRTSGCTGLTSKRNDG